MLYKYQLFTRARGNFLSGDFEKSEKYGLLVCQFFQVCRKTLFSTTLGPRSPKMTHKFRDKFNVHIEFVP